MGFSLFTDLITPTSYDVPDAATVDIDKEQLANVKSNAASFAAAKQLATEFNDFMQEEVSKRLRQTMPELEGLEKSAADNIAAGLRGELSQSDSAASQRSSAARALGLGIGGSQAGSGLILRDLGLRQEQAKSQAMAQLPGFVSTFAGVKRAPLFDFSNTFMTPQQRIEIQFQNEINKWNVKNLRNQMDAQPDPWMKSLAGFGDSILDLAGSYVTGGMAQPGSAKDRGSKTGFNVGQYQQQARMMEESGRGVGANYGPPANSGYWKMFE